MPKRLPDSDFRARRIVLARRDFAYAPKPEPPASDVISKSTWKSIVTLPDDVAVRTSNYHGSALKQLDDLWGAWVESFGDVQDCLFSVMLDSGDDFHSDGDMRRSNGPIYVRSAFNHISWMQFETIGLSFVLLLLARPHATIPQEVVRLFKDVSRVRSRVTRCAFNALYPHAESRRFASLSHIRTHHAHCGN
jgi:hypothetical protein